MFEDEGGEVEMVLEGRWCFFSKSIYGSAERESIKVDESTFVHLAEFSLKFPDIDKSGGGSKEVARPETARWAAASSETDSNGSADVKVFKLGLTK